MDCLKIFICVSLLLFSFSCYGKDAFSCYEMTKKEIFVSKGDTINLNYTNISNLLKLGKIEKVIEILKIKPELALSLALQQVEAIGWKNWVIINKTIFPLLPEDIISDTEIDNWADSLDKDITIKLLERKLETTLIQELETDWLDWCESKHKLSPKETKLVTNQIRDKIKHLTNQKHKEVIIKLFQNTELDIVMTQE